MSAGIAKKLRSAGVPQEQAEAHAEAARELVMAELVTRHDLEVARSDLDGRIAAVRSDLELLRRDLEAKVASLEGSIDRLSLRLTVRMGVMLAAAIAVLATINRL